MTRTLDAVADLPVRQRRISAAGSPAPETTAPRSVFDQARPSKDAPIEIVIRKGVPIPAARTTPGCSVLVKAAQQMEPGDSVELPLTQAKSLMRIARKVGDAIRPPRHFVFRKLSDELGAVWRDR